MYKYTHGLFELDNSRVYTCVYTAYMSDLLCIPHESKTESDLSSTVELGGTDHGKLLHLCLGSLAENG